MLLTLKVRPIHLLEMVLLRAKILHSIRNDCGYYVFDAGLSKTFWGYAYLAATHVRNRIPTTVTRDDGSSFTPRSPYELWQGHVPNIHYLRRWG
jgi:hypothetical protein